MATKLKITLLLFIATNLFSCKKEKTEMVYMNCSTFVDEAIINYADPAGDGCGWTINIQPNPVPIPVVQNVWFSPNNLAPVFQVEGLHVKLTYKFEGNGYYCGLGNTKLETITILMIEEL